MKKIKRCPCCGGTAKIRKFGNAYAVRCNDCGMASGKVYRNSGVSPAVVQNFVIDTWNNRKEVTNEIK